MSMLLFFTDKIRMMELEAEQARRAAEKEEKEFAEKIRHLHTKRKSAIMKAARLCNG